MNKLAITLPKIFIAKSLLDEPVYVPLRVTETNSQDPHREIHCENDQFEGVYSGPINHGKADGHGVIQWGRRGQPNNYIYDGDFKEGRPEGFGVYGIRSMVWVNHCHSVTIYAVSALKCKYEGHFLSGYAEGNGILTYGNSNKFTYGTDESFTRYNENIDYFSWQNKKYEAYKGSFSRGYPDGFGALTTLFGSYEGGFSANQACTHPKKVRRTLRAGRLVT